MFAAFGDANIDLSEKDIKDLSINEYENLYDESKTQATAITIHPKLLEESLKNIALTIFQDDSLFITASNKTSNTTNNDGPSFSINTNIIAASVGQRNVTEKLTVPVNISLAHKLVSTF